MNAAPINPPQLLAAIAATQLGASEDPVGSNRGEALRRYFAADNYDPREEGAKSDDGYPWCACFVSWCVQELCRQLAAKGHRFPPPWTMPATAAAYGLESWGRRAGCQVLVLDDQPQHRPQVGDLVTYTFSHCGIVHTVQHLSPYFGAVEGNTNRDGARDGYEVALKARVFARVRSLIRLPALA